MSDEHKAALAEGRRQGRDVRDYLNALERGKRRGRRLSPEELESRVAGLRDRIAEEPDAARRLELVQQRLDYEDRLAAESDEPDMESLEAAFVTAARPYSERKGISWTAWRELGVPAAVLKRAGVPRTRRTSPG
jgi:hypothetical protein